MWHDLSLSAELATARRADRRRERRDWVTMILASFGRRLVTAGLGAAAAAFTLVVGRTLLAWAFGS